MALSLVLLCLLIVPSGTCAQETGLRPMTLHVGYTRASFRDVNQSDATAAFRVFAQTAARKRGYKLETDMRFFDSPAAFEAEIKKGGINLAIVDSWNYLGMDIQVEMEPVFVHLQQGTIFRTYLLLTRRGSGLTNLADLRNKDLLVLDGKGGDLSRAWLDHLLLASRLGSKEAFFGKLEPVAKPAAAVLPVFFGTKPACLANRAAFQIMCELNPQVGNNLVVVAVSEPYLENITCISRSGWPSQHDRQELIKAIAEFHLDANGRQILELFELDQMVPFQESYMDTARKLKASFASLGKNFATLPASEARSEP
jgi:phosphonate transport system substrate-binding protein